MAKNPNATLLRLIRHTQGTDPATRGTVTTPELAKMAGLDYAIALGVVHQLVADGKLRPEKVWRRNIHGELQRVKGFRVA